MSRPSVPGIRDIMIFMAWIAGIVCIGCLCWILTGPFRAGLLQQAVNKILTETDVRFRLESPAVVNSRSPGTWYETSEGSLVLVFSIMADGIFMPCAAVVNSMGMVDELIPLTAGSRKMLDRISPGLIRLHIRRIQGEQ